MSDLTAKFNALEIQLEAADAAMQVDLNAIRAQLELVNTQLDTQTINNAANTLAIINALNASAACNPCPVPPIMGSPPVTTPGSINANWCQRVQAFLAVIDLFADYADSLGTLSNAFTPGFVTGIIEEIRTTTGDSGIPVPGWIDTIQIAADGVNFIVNRALLGGSLHASFDPIKDDLRAALFATSSASAAKSAYDAGIDLAPGLAASQPLLKGLGFSDLMNHFFDPASSPVVGSYNGSLCGSFSCYTLDETQYLTQSTETGPKVIPDWTVYGLTITTNSGHDNPIWIAGNYRGWTWEITNNTSVVYHTDVFGFEDGFELTGTWPNTIAETNQITFVSDNPFAIEFCAPLV